VFVARQIETDLHAVHPQHETRAQHVVLYSAGDIVCIMGYIIDLHRTMADASDD